MRTVAGTLALGLAGCGTYETFRPDGTLASRGFGLMPVVVAPDAGILRTRNIGLTVSPLGDTVGASALEVITPPKDCFTVIMLPTAEEARRWAALARDTERVCHKGTIE